MLVSFGRKSKLPAGQIANSPATNDSKTPLIGQSETLDSFLVSKARARLIDLRAPEQFRAGFIPGSFNLPDLNCWLAAKQNKFFDGREIYVLADHVEQLRPCEDSANLDPNSELIGWFGPDALDEWRKADKGMGELEVVNADALTIRQATWNTLVLDIVEDRVPTAKHPLCHESALRFCLSELPVAMDGLPLQTGVCISAANDEIASFAASLLWNFGFHKIGYVSQKLNLRPNLPYL